MLSTTIILNAVQGHGFLAKPVARNVKGSGFAKTTDCPHCLGHNNADQNAIHGICGDGPTGAQEWAAPGPVVATYGEGGEIEVEMRITANHLGWIEMDLCDSPDIDEECFARHRLERVGCSAPEGAPAETCRALWVPGASANVAGYTTGNGAAYPAGAPYFDYAGGNTFGANLKGTFKLPAGVSCTHCVLRWHYHTTNSCSNADRGSEEFWNCADIAIEAAAGATADTAVDGAELEALRSQLVARAPQGKVTGAMSCATFGRPFGSGGFASVAPEGKAGYADVYGMELAQPGSVFGCANQPAAGPQGCIFTVADAAVALWGTGVTAPTGGTTTKAPMTPSTTRAPTDGNCAVAWAQCGGQGWTGSTCCIAGHVCNVHNQWWSGCEPGVATTKAPTTSSTTEAPTTITTTTEAPTTSSTTEAPTTTKAPTTSSTTEPPPPTTTKAPTDGNCAVAWAQCGGQGWTGSTCCIEGHVCKMHNQWWSGCEPGVATTKAPTTSSTTRAPTDGSCAVAWAQCGGQGWTGSTCCIEGHACKAHNQWWSGCEPGVATTKAPTTSSTTEAPSTTATTTTTTSSSSSSSSSSATTGGSMSIGYYENWAQYRNGAYTYVPENVDATKLTHICYAFAMPDANFEIQPFEWNDVLDWDPAQGMYARFHAHVRAQNPAIKTLISLGGWTFNAKPETNWIFSTLSAAPASRATFIRSSIAFARTHGFDGVDIDWEYPGHAGQGGRPEDRANFVLLLKEFREAIAAEAAATGQPPLLLAIAVAALNPTLSNAYDVQAIHPHLDWIGVMAYDLHGSWEGATGLHTQLRSPDGVSVAAAMETWLGAGAPADKLVMGVGSYGRGWTLADASISGVGAPAKGGSTPQPGTGEAGYMAATEIAALKAAGGVVTSDPDRGSSYLVLGDQWVGFDTVDDVRLKVAWARDRGFAGAMTWAIGLDDFRNGYPYLTAIQQALAGDAPKRQRRYLRGRRV